MKEIQTVSKLRSGFTWGYFSILVSFFLGYCFLSRSFPFWSDEVYSVLHLRGSAQEFLQAFFANPDNHPPLYYLTLNLWKNLLGLGIHNDDGFRYLSTAFHFLTIIFISFRFYSGQQQGKRIFFLVLTCLSSYFFMYAHMVRYYTMAAFLFVVCYYYFFRWISQGMQSYRYALIWFFISILLSYTDYPSFVLFGVTSLSTCLCLKRFPPLKLIVAFAAGYLIFLTPILYLNYVYFFQLGNGSTVNSFNNSIEYLAFKLIAGILFIPYQIIIGEYFNVKLFPLIALFLIVLFIFTISGLKSKFHKASIRYSFFFILINAVSIALLLTFLIGRYPVFSFARFVLPVGYVLFYLFIELFYERKKWLLLAILGINCVTVFSNISKRDFINPAYFQPQDLVISQLNRIEEPLFAVSDYDYSISSEYLIRKLIPEKRVLHIDQTAVGEQFYMIAELHMRSSEDTFLQITEERYDVKVLKFQGFDNINADTKSLLHQLNWMKAPYRYYSLLVEKQ